MNKTNFHIPECKFREDKEMLYPKNFINKIEVEKFLYLDEVRGVKKDPLEKYFGNLTLEKYYKEYSKNSRGRFRLHSKLFQLFCIRQTNDLSPKELYDLSISKSSARKRLSRSRIYGISCMEGVGWNGELIDKDSEEARKKKTEIMDIHNSLKLYDWAKQPKEFDLPEPRFDPKECEYSFYRMGTQPCLLELHKKYNSSRSEKSEEIEGEGEEEQNSTDTVETRSNMRIGWLNLANAHHVCGIYSTDLGGSQEEHVATSCTGAATLSTLGTFYNSGPRNWVTGAHVNYKNGFHIPPGGNYFCKTKFLSGEPFGVDCFMVAHAFVDLRKYIPLVHTNTERGYYFSLFGSPKMCKDDPKKSLLEERIEFDIEACVRTCVVEKIYVLVAGASGCGAFRHDPKLESAVWKRVLEKYRGYFKEVAFAVLDAEDSKNVECFKKEFGSS